MLLMLLANFDLNFTVIYTLIDDAIYVRVYASCMQEQLIHERRKKRKKHGRDSRQSSLKIGKLASGRTAIIVGGSKKTRTQKSIGRKYWWIRRGDREFQSERGFS